MDGTLINLRTKQKLKLCAFNPMANSHVINVVEVGQDLLNSTEVFLGTAYLIDNLDQKDLLDKISRNDPEVANDVYRLKIRNWYEVRGLESFDSYVILKGIDSAPGTKEFWYTLVVSAIKDNLDLCSQLEKMDGGGSLDEKR